MRSRALGLLFLAWLAWVVAPAPGDAAPLPARGGVVTTVHPRATDAGLAALRRGGNAVDAAVAAALTLGVVDGHNSGIGGGCFLLLRLADGRIVAIEGRETAGARATRDMYLRDGEPQADLSRTGPLASGVPGALAAYDHAVRHHGRLRLSDLLLPAAELAEDGSPVSRPCADALKREAGDLARFAAARAVLLKDNAVPYGVGEILKQPDLARTYRRIAAHGIEWFYDGPPADRVGKWMAEHGGILTAGDFARYRARVRKPVRTGYRGYTVLGFPPPSSGGVHVAQILNMLERFDLKAMYARCPAEFCHVLAEAMKLAFADRAHWLGDPDFTDVPRGLLEKRYAAELAERIDRTRAVEVSSHGQPPGWQSDHFPSKRDEHTTHVAAVDAEGNWVALTATLNTSFGSKVIVPGTGVILNNQMDDFSAAPGTPNAFGLVGAEANAIAPGKRPLSSMSPTIVLEHGRPVLTVGAAGGPTIISQVVLAIVYHLDLGMDLRDAVAGPRIHHQWLPDQLRVERLLPRGVAAELTRRGHTLRWEKSFGVTQAIAVGPEGTALVGVRDPRVCGRRRGD